MDRHGSVVKLGRDGHLASLGELDGVRDQVGQDLREAGRIRQDLRQGSHRRLDHETESLGARGGFLPSRHLLDDLVEVERLGLERQLAAFEPQEIDIVPQAPRAYRRVSREDLDGLALLLRELSARTVEQALVGRDRFIERPRHFVDKPIEDERNLGPALRIRDLLLGSSKPL